MSSVSKVGKVTIISNIIYVSKESNVGSVSNE